MKKSKLLADSVYEEEVERLSGLPKFPQLPKAQQELRRALRRISESDGEFLHKLISDVVDSATICPTPAELITVAGAKRHRAQQSIGKPDCDLCAGAGFITIMRKVSVPGIEPYESEFAAACKCRAAGR